MQEPLFHLPICHTEGEGVMKTIAWRLDDGRLHRTDGPALEYGFGRMEWHVMGLRHRIGGPAIMDYMTDECRWFVDGKLHRTDGPAVHAMMSDEKDEYWIRGEHVTKDDPRLAKL